MKRIRIGTLNSNVLLKFLKGFYDRKEYSEVVNISCYLDLSTLPIEVIEILSLSYFRLRLYSSCIVYSKAYLMNNEDNYLILEVLGESLYQQNFLEDSLFYYKKALKLRPTLKVAKHRVLSLKYRLDRVVDQILLKEVKGYALQKNRMNYLRTVAYILVNEKKYKEAISCFKEIFSRDKSVYYMDYHLFFNNANLVGKCSDSYFLELNDKKKDALFEYRIEENNSDTLFVSLAPGDKYIFQKYKYESDKLFIIDSSMTYYALSAKKIVFLIKKLIEKKQYKKVSIVGSSKGGTGVFFILNELEKLNLNVEIRAVSFSPQVSLYPFNRNLTIPSYVTLFNNLQCNDFLEKEFSYVSSLISFDFISDIKLTVFYGNRFSMDKKEIEYLPKENQSVSVVSLEFSGHVSMIPLTIPENKSLDDLKKSYSHLQIDPDMEALGGRNLIDIVDEIFAIYSNPEMRLHKFLC